MTVMRASLAFGLLLFPALAGAQTPPPAEPPPRMESLPPPRGRIDLTTPPPSPMVGRSYHLHDGFYLRGSVGLGSLGASFDDDHSSRRDLSGSGFSLGADLMIGGSPSPGLSLGGALLAEGAFSAEFDRDSDLEEDRSLAVFVLGPFVDAFPAPNRGWHFGGTVGLALAKIEGSRNDDVTSTRGVGGAFWVGHDFWVADEWSVGPMLRLTGTLTRDGDTDANASSFSALILFTALRN